MAGFKTRSTRRSLRSVSRQIDHLHELTLLYCRLVPASPQELLLLLGEPTPTSITTVRKEEKLQKRAEVKKLRTGPKDTRRSSR